MHESCCVFSEKILESEKSGYCVFISFQNVSGHILPFLISVSRVKLTYHGSVASFRFFALGHSRSVYKKGASNTF